MTSSGNLFVIWHHRNWLRASYQGLSREEIKPISSFNVGATQSCASVASLCLLYAPAHWWLHPPHFTDDLVGRHLLQNGLTWSWLNTVWGSRWERGQSKQPPSSSAFCDIHSSCLFPCCLKPKELISKKAFLQTEDSDECLPSLETVTALGLSHTPNYDCLARPEYRWRKSFMEGKHDIEDKNAQLSTQNMHWRKSGLRKQGSLPPKWLRYHRALSRASPSLSVFCFCY